MKKENEIIKSFPTDPSMEYDKEGNLILTFLNDSKVDAELYAYLLSISLGIDKETRTYKKDMLSIKQISTEILQVKSRQTVYNHLNYLIEQDYITDKGDYYLINNKQSPFLKIPLDLVKYFCDNLKEAVLKVYLYLGQRYIYKPQEWEFSIKELCEHLGLNYNVKRNREKISNTLSILSDVGLISYKVIKKDNLTFLMKLTNFSTQKPKSDADIAV